MSYSIRAEGLGKRYRLERENPVGRTLVDALGAWMRRRRAATPPNGDFWALRGVDVEIAQGDAIGVIGRNGAGKSTLLKILSRVTDPTEGTLRLRGRVASLLEIGTGFHHELSGRENVFLNGAILGMNRREVAARFDEIVDYAGVARFIDQPLKHYSSGMQARLAFAVAAFLESEILIVDEVLAVGDLAFQEKCLATMGQAASGGRTVLFVSHNMSAVTRLTRRCLLLDAGRVVFDGDPAAATRHYVGMKRAHASGSRRPVEQIVCSRRLRASTHVTIVEMGLAEGQGEEISVGGNLRMEFLLESNSTYTGLRIAYSINSAAGPCVVTGITPPFTVRPGRQLFELQLQDLDLVPGDYDFSVNLGAGGWSDRKGESDSFVGFGYLRVAETFADGQPFGPWNSQWAPVIHRRCHWHERALADTALASGKPAAA